MKKQLLSSAALFALAIPGFAIVTLVAPNTASAQETTSSIQGSVTEGDAAVSGAEVVVTHVPSGTRSTAKTGADGNFSVSGLRVGGPFTVTVHSPLRSMERRLPMCTQSPGSRSICLSISPPVVRTSSLPLRK
ncbi:carboxypeptidase-like regulatory domain-containing protein [Sphingomonas paeninsulae]|uniref:carboxypeptidase-like regulatory domain-containing protein n=1 Tax=Sphingomonas paeninsulae TaxID=2319844 RepID=UPI001EEFA6BF|nr:carboxypeptidase-like regulatory domain-containing protein [Sphingomonas paeninsulae]